ncbi:unnamed protein product [Notodromas monacha]|uniref:HPS5-like beta-propeller domain-containing protein n=1 Tax=Notodromas monacha TaxID=399045 RepID=A0A7R9BHJ4_9CRUS|nr:unnamed protein product [Notodromas monacha]CAG0915583.1 unnamed protein product [Notodromas monacha]
MPSFQTEHSDARVELVDVDILKTGQVRFTDRIKYACFDVSKSWLVCGTVAGSLHIFERGSCKLQRIVPLKDGNVKQVALSESGPETWVAYGCESGSVGVVLIDRCREEIDSNWSSLSSTSAVTCLKWSSSSSSPRSLFVGDVSGRVLQSFVSCSRPVNFFRDNSIKLAAFDAEIVQLDELESDGRFLLVSTSRRTYVLDVVRELFVAVGKKPRDAPLGACFALDSEGNLRVFAVRPKGRIWEAELDGQVIRTLQLPPVIAVPVATFGSGDVAQEIDPFLTKIVYERHSRCLVGFSSNFLHILDPDDGRVLASSIAANSASIVDVKTANGAVFVQYREKSASIFAELKITVPGRIVQHPEEPPRKVEEEWYEEMQWEQDDGWIAANMSMMAIGMYSPDILSFNEEFFGDLSIKMRDKVSKWLKSSPPVMGTKPSEALPVVPETRNANVVGIKIATDVKTLVKELGEKAVILNSLHGDPAMTEEECRALFENWMKYLEGFPETVHAVTKFRFPTSAWAAIIPEEVRKVNSHVVARFSSETVEPGVEEAFDVNELHAMFQNEEDFCWDVDKVWFLLDGSRILSQMTEMKLSLSCRKRLWTIADQVLLRASNSSQEVDETRIFAFPKRSWLPVIKSRLKTRQISVGSFAKLLHEADDTLLPVELLFLLAESANDVDELLKSFQDFWRFADDRNRQILEAASLLYGFDKLAVQAIAGQTGEDGRTLVEIGKNAGWLCEDALHRIWEEVDCADVIENLIGPSLRVCGAEKTLGFLEKAEDKFSFNKRLDFWRFADDRNRQILEAASLLYGFDKLAVQAIVGQTGEDGRTLVEIGKNAGWLCEDALHRIWQEVDCADVIENLIGPSLRVCGAEKTLGFLEKAEDKFSLNKSLLTKVMLCCYAEGKHGMDSRTAALSLETAAETRSPLAPLLSTRSPEAPLANSVPFYHWSTCVDADSACCSCGIALCNELMRFADDGRYSGLVVFKCGHPYHATCLSDAKLCFLCR